jgi:hypothetical protein
VGDIDGQDGAVLREPAARARSVAMAMACIIATSPKPWPQSSTKVAARSCVSRGRAFASISPREIICR